MEIDKALAKRKMRTHHWRATRAALQIQHLYLLLGKEKPEDPWHKQGEKQSYYDALTAMRINHLIEDFDFVKETVRCQGFSWSLEDIPKKFQLRFKKSKS